MRELFIDASRGLAGDMLSAALLQLFEDPEDMLAQLRAIGMAVVQVRKADFPEITAAAKD